MSSRPRRSAAQKASVAITDMADRDNMSTSRSRRSGDGKGFASVSRGSGEKDHTYLTVKLPASKLRQATSSRQGSSISVNSDSAPKRSTRGGKKNYVVESESDEEEEKGEDEIQVGAPVVEEDDDEDEEMEDPDEDAEGEIVEDEMDVDVEDEDEDDDDDQGDEDAEGEEDMDMAPPHPAPVIKISKPSKTSPASGKTKNATPRKGQRTTGVIPVNDSEDDELSELDSDDEDMNAGGEEDAEGDEEDEDMDAEGEEIEEERAAGAEPEPDAEANHEPEDIDSDDETPAAMSRGDTPDLSRMTIRQRARFEELDSSHYQALSNEVQAKKHFTAEEKAMRRAEMARRRRNLSEKRNEEVKQETINKLLKKQAVKINRKNLQSIGEEDQDSEERKKPSSIFIRWVSSQEGERIAIPEEILDGPAGRLFVNAVPSKSATRAGLARARKMVEEV